MTDTTFSNSYIETDAILEAMIGADPRAAAIALKALAAASQAWYCQEATRHIDQLTLAGQKYDTDIAAGVAVEPLDLITLDGIDRPVLQVDAIPDGSGVVRFREVYL